MAMAVEKIRILPGTKRDSLDLIQLKNLEQSFRAWSEKGTAVNRRSSRKRVLLIFLLIRYSGARLNEILNLNLVTDIDYRNQRIIYQKNDHARTVQLPEVLLSEIKDILVELEMRGSLSNILKVDPAHVRRKFYACTEAAGLPRKLGTPEAIRRFRAIELMQSNVPLPVVQKIMGHATPNLAASYVEFSDEELKKAERFYIELENKRKTSARNSFFGKIDKVRAGDIMSGIEIASIDNQRIYSVVTNFSLEKLNLMPGCLVTAEVKAPWIVLYKGIEEPACTAENRFKGSVLRIIRGMINSEVVVQISSTTELCAILTQKSIEQLNLQKDDTVWAVFNSSTIVIHTE